MPKAAGIDEAQKSFAELTGMLEDIALLASEGQAAPNLPAARRLADRLIRRLGTSTKRAQQLRGRLR